MRNVMSSPLSRALRVMLLVSAAAPLSAQRTARDSTRTDSLRRSARLTPVVTTASRTAAAAGDIAQRVRIVSSDEIARTPALDVADLLKRSAGLDIVQYPSLLAGVGIRGFRPETGGLQKRALLLVDGRPADVTNLALLDLAGVERIEVLKGAASALYGSSAEGGVVNVITRRTVEGRSGMLSAAGGSFATSDLVGHAGGRLSDRVDADVDGHFYRAGGAYRIGAGNLFRNALGGSTATRIFPDGRETPLNEIGSGETRSGTRYGYSSGAARVGVTLGHGMRVDARGDGLTANDVETPGDLNYGDAQNAFKNVHRGGGELALSGAGERGTFRLRVYDGRETGDYFNSAAATRFVNFTQVTTTAGAQLEGTTEWRSVAITAGADATRAQAKSSRYTAPGTAAGTYSPDSRNGSAAIFAQGRSPVFGGRAILTLGGRLDRVRVRLLETALRPDVSPAADAFTVFNPSAGLVVPIGALRAHASAGRGFVTPDAFSRAGLSQTAPVNNVVAITLGNAALLPEHATTLDAGLGVTSRSGFDADVTVFSTNVRDRITSARASYAAGSRPTTVDGYQVSRVQTSVNAGTAAMRGIETTLGYDLGAALHRDYRLRLRGEYTRLLTAVERTRTASVDTTGAGSRTGVTAASLAQAFIFGAETERPIRNVARATITGALEYDDFRLLRGRLGGRYVGRRRDADFSDPTITADVEYPPFLVLDATGGVRITERLRGDLTIANLTDENYYEKRGYSLPGRTLLFRLTTTF